MTNKITPRIAFKHVLEELSVNRKDPCEVIRELISNSYDARASGMWYAPLIEERGFVFLDDGTGMSLDDDPVHLISPFASFFSIGCSTKTRGAQVGHKCQGSKLCFASQRILLVTKTQHDAKWHTKQIENPLSTINEDYDLTPEATDQPELALAALLPSADERSTQALDAIKDVLSKIETGSLIVVIGLKTSEYEKHFDTYTTEIRRSYIWNYIRHSTKHGDTCQLGHSGFKPRDKKNIEARAAEPAALSLFTGDKGWVGIPHGYPYLPLASSTDAPSPKNISRLRDGRFQAREARQVKHAGRDYAFILAVDGRRRRLNEYSALGRERDSASGVRLTDQCGTFISSHGIKCAPFNDIFDQPGLAEFRCLKDANAQIHYSLFIDGPFELVTNRNAVEQRALNTLSDNEFIKKLNQFLTDAKVRSPVLDELITRLTNERTEADLNAAMDKIRAIKAAISDRERFSIDLDPKDPDTAVTMFVPRAGEEHGTGALYAMLALLANAQPDRVPEHLRDLWLRPLTFSGVGIDAVAVPYGESKSGEADRMMLEYKQSLGKSDSYNHPLFETDQIVAWEVTLKIGDSVEDDFEIYGSASEIPGIDPSIALQLDGLESRDDQTYNHRVVIVSLRELARKTFDLRYRTPPPRKNGKK